MLLGEDSRCSGTFGRGPHHPWGRLYVCSAPARPELESDKPSHVTSSWVADLTASGAIEGDEVKWLQKNEEQPRQ